MTKSTLSRRMADIRRRKNELSPRLSNVTPEQVVARANLRFQRDMVNQFRSIRESAGLSPAQLADQLGATEKMINSIEDFEYDLSLTEIRHLALALDAIVEVQVHISTAQRYAETANKHLAELLNVGELWGSAKNSVAHKNHGDAYDFHWTSFYRSKDL